MDQPLANKTCLVTGAAGGFGEGIVRRYHADGADVVIADIKDEAGAAVAESLGERARYVHCDVTDGDSVAAAVQAALDAFGGLDVVVNNGGATHRNQPLLDVDAATFDKVIAVNMKSIFYMVHAAVSIMRAAGVGSCSTSAPRRASARDRG